MFFFKKKIRSEEGKKNKISKKFIFFKKWIEIFGLEGEKNKKCHFYYVTLKNRQQKSYFFKLNLAISFIGGNKKGKNKI